MSDSPPRIGFVHIPKTAGMSVRAALQHHYPEGEVGVTRFDDRLFGAFTAYDTFAPSLRAETLLPGDPTPADAARPLQLGHLSLQGMCRLVPAERVVTFLREPRARLLSHHLYWAVRPADQNDAFGDYQVQRLATGGLEGFLTADAAAHQHDNLQCRMLVDEPRLIPRDRPIDPAHHAEVAAMALAALEHLGHVGLVEDPAMWTRLGAWAGLSLAPVRTNVTEAGEQPIRFGGPQLTPDVVAIVEARSAADLLLYRAMVARLLPRAGDPVAFADRQFVAQVERYGRVVATAEATRATRAAAAPADDPAEVPVATARLARWRRR
ncbi:MAG: hypothetical protein KDB06_09620 [Ilumatobacter sp.]|nr:hypothetical protein [Ilumatobacter sp.]MCB0984892.1 hypothetical protein [Ilumatobacter sp.]